ncbi:DUF5926 family protein, partial [Streptomyces sp. W16]|uniref:DUF5926 family protein n=1 Tax=Streptomyces sp. W16 TaxID=3076631 RepID=UPI003FA37B23
ENTSPEVTASLERANAAAIPTVKLQGVDAAYWCETPDKNHLRRVMPHPEEQLLDGLARLHAAGRSGLGDGTRLVGSFRAHGLTAPVWDLPSGLTTDDIEKPTAEFTERTWRAYQPTGHTQLTHGIKSELDCTVNRFQNPPANN